jgi:20S proteasome alpha/beta subunit
VCIIQVEDHVDLATFFIRTTIDAQKLTVGLRGCGGPIDVATITRRDGFKFISKKEIKVKGDSVR